MSRIARRTTAWRPIWTPSISTAPSTCAQEWTFTFGDTIEFSTSEPEITEPGDTIELTARPTRSPQACTNLAGGYGGCSV